MAQLPLISARIRQTWALRELPDGHPRCRGIFGAARFAGYGSAIIAEAVTSRAIERTEAALDERFCEIRGLWPNDCTLSGRAP